MNTKIHKGPRYGHFYVMPEDNLIHLKEGTARIKLGQKTVTAPPMEEPMVMIYPKEGSMARNNCACIVDAPWVTAEQVAAAERWIDFLREDEQQRLFMEAGFRPVAGLSLTDHASKITKEFGLDMTKPTKQLSPARIAPEVAAAIDASWDDVKRPGIVTFVVDASGSMLGEKLNQAKDGIVRALDAMARNNQVGFLSFDNKVKSRVPVAPLASSRFDIADAVHKLGARGGTALYDAVKEGIEMTDAAEGEQEAIRAVVVLTDGQANKGNKGLDDVIRMMTRGEEPVRQFDGHKGESSAIVGSNRRVDKTEVIGTGLALNTRNEKIQVFFIGIGDDADLEVGRLLAEATGAEFQGVAEDDLANVLEEFSGYF